MLREVIEWRIEVQEKSRMMAINRNYSPVETLENEELYRHGIFEWNISKLLRYIKENERNIIQSAIDVEKQFHSASINQNM
jgi:hypothetical protein